MRPKYNHLYVIAFSVDSDDQEGGSPGEIMRALRGRVHELEETGEILEAVGVPDETIDNETWLEVETHWLGRKDFKGQRSRTATPRRPQTRRRGRPAGGDAGAR